MKEPSQHKLRTAIIFLSLMLLTISAALAYTEKGSDGIIVYEIKPVSSFLKPLAIVLPKSVYSPGETFSTTIGSSVPGNTQQVMLTIVDSNGNEMYKKDITGMFSPYSTSYVKITLSAPKTVGYYEIIVSFNDYKGLPIYQEMNFFDVKRAIINTQTCPATTCTGWTSIQKFEHGTLQQKTCYLYKDGWVASLLKCPETAEQFTRTVCDAGYELNNGACIKPNNEPTCGDRVVQTGEECDSGDDNGVCPQYCNAFCKKNTCNTIPNERAPANDDTSTTADDKKDDDEVIISKVLVLLIGLFFVIFGAILLRGR